MTSLSKTIANQINAKSSTGPKTQTGLQRSCRNARRHGLSIPVQLDPIRAREIKTLAVELAQDLPEIGSTDLAYSVAETEIDLKRIRKIRLELLSELDGSEADVSNVLEELVQIDRYECRALARRNAAVRRFTKPVENDPLLKNWQNEAKNINDIK
jgi:hypothetical protein